MSTTVGESLDDHGLCGIRPESIGGLSADLVWLLQGEPGVPRLGLNASRFPSYRSEEKGTPVKSHIRFCDPGWRVPRIREEARNGIRTSESCLACTFHS